VVHVEQLGHVHIQFIVRANVFVLRTLLVLIRLLLRRLLVLDVPSGICVVLGLPLNIRQDLAADAQLNWPLFKDFHVAVVYQSAGSFATRLGSVSGRMRLFRFSRNLSAIQYALL